MPAPLSSSLFIAAGNRLLAHQPAARARLARHAGSHVCLGLPLLRLHLRISDDGQLDIPPEGAPDTEITLSADLLPRLLAGDPEAMRTARVDGDAVLAADLVKALEGFDWALALQPYLGDSLASRAAQLFTGLAGWHAQARASLGAGFADYAEQEAGLLADRRRVDRFIADVDALRDDVARLEARLARLEPPRTDR